MGARQPAIFPAWVRTVGAALDEGAEIICACPACKQWREADLAAISAAKGCDYSLINRRLPCRLTPGCSGLVRFHYMLGVRRPLWDDETACRWIDEDRRRE